MPRTMRSVRVRALSSVHDKGIIWRSAGDRGIPAAIPGLGEGAQPGREAVFDADAGLAAPGLPVNLLGHSGEFPET